MLIVLSFSSCSSDDEKVVIAPKTALSVVEKPLIRDMLTVKKSTDLISRFLYEKIGVFEIQVSDLKNRMIYHAKSKNSVILNGKFFSLSDFDLLVTESGMRVNEDYKLSLDAKGDWLLNTPKYSGKLKNAPNKIVKEVNVFALCLWVNEIATILPQNKQVVSLENGGVGGCSFWNTYTAVGLGATSSAAYASFC